MLQEIRSPARYEICRGFRWMKYCRRSGELAVDFLEVTDLDDEHESRPVLNGVDNSVVAFADPKEIFFAGEFLHAMRRGFSRRDLSLLTIRF